MLRRPHGRASVNPDSPRAFAICDRCGCLTNLHRLSWQHQWNGTVLQNMRWLVCEDCLDIPAPFLQFYLIPPDPRPIANPRTEPYMLDEVDYLSTQQDVPITTQDDREIVTNQASQNFSDPPPEE